MKEYRVSWDQLITYMAFVKADSEDDAIKKVKSGDYYNVDTEPSNGIMKNIQCDGEAG